jgi:hypothetical protein
MKRTKKPQTRTLDKKPAFLKAYIACADLTRAAAAVKIDRGQHYEWLKSDAKYAALFEAAKEQAAQTLEDDAVHWARVGTFEQYTYQGRPQFAQRERVKCRLPDGREVYKDEFRLEELAAMEIQSERTVTEDDPRRPLGQFRRSEGLMGRLLSAFMPKRYAARTEITGKDGAPLEIITRLEAARRRKQ